jgi:hypothetical protein
MAHAFLQLAADPDAARAQARAGREYVRQEWSKEKAFGDLRRVLQDVVNDANGARTESRRGTRLHES